MSRAPTSDLPAAADNPARELLRILARGKVTIVTVFLLVGGLVTFVALRTPPTYVAESSLMVRIGREYIYRPEVGRTESARIPSLSEIVNSEVEILSSRDLAEQVVRELGVGKLYPELLELEPDANLAAEKAVLRFRQAASIRPVLESSVIKVGFEHPVPATAAAAVNLLVDRFKDKHIEVFGEDESGRLEIQLQERVAALAAAEAALADFKSQNSVFDLDEQRNLLLGRRLRLQEDLHLCERSLAEQRVALPPGEQLEAAPVLPPHLALDMKGELVRQRFELERDLHALEPATMDRLVESVTMRLLELELEERRLLRDFNESNRQVQSVREELARVRGFLSDAERRAGSLDEVRRREREDGARALQAAVTRLSGEIELLVRAEEFQARAALRQAVAALEIQRQDDLRRLEELERQIQTLDQHERVQRTLERELTQAEAGVGTYQQRLDEARISEELDREKRINVRVIEMAAAPVEPSGLSPKLKIALGAFVGLLTGAGLAVLLDLFRAR